MLHMQTSHRRYWKHVALHRFHEYSDGRGDGRLELGIEPHFLLYAIIRAREQARHSRENSSGYKSIAILCITADRFGSWARNYTDLGMQNKSFVHIQTCQFYQIRHCIRTNAYFSHIPFILFYTPEPPPPPLCPCPWSSNKVGLMKFSSSCLSQATLSTSPRAAPRRRSLIPATPPPTPAACAVGIL